MSQLRATRLRFISSATADALSAFISDLPFKIEIKSIIQQGDRFYCFFVLPEFEGLEFASVNL